MLVRFWGTRGSLPVAPTADAIRRKIANALRRRRTAGFADAAEAEAFVERELEFRGRRNLRRRDRLRRDRSRRRLLFHLRHGQRPEGIRAGCAEALRRGPPARPIISSSRTCTGTISWGSPSSRRRSIRTRRSSSMPAIPMPSRRFAASRRKSPSRCRSTGCAPTSNSSQLTPGRAVSRSTALRVETKLQHHSHDSYGYRFTDARRANGHLQHRQRA